MPRVHRFNSETRRNTKTRMQKMLNIYWNNKSLFHLHVHLCLGQLFHILPCKTQDQTYLEPCSEISLSCWALGNVREHHSAMEPIKKELILNNCSTSVKKCPEVSQNQHKSCHQFVLWSSGTSYCPLTCLKPCTVADTISCLWQFRASSGNIIFSEYIYCPNPSSNKVSISQQ